MEAVLNPSHNRTPLDNGRSAGKVVRPVAAKLLFDQMAIPVPEIMDGCCVKLHRHET
jgi:hypothetical protein